MLVLVVVAVLSLTAGGAAAWGVRRWPQADPAAAASRSLEGEMIRWGRVRRFLRSRLDPATITGLALSVALLAVILGGVALGVVVYMIRTDSGVVRIDQAVARWAADHVEGVSFDVLGVLTVLGSTPAIVVLATATALSAMRQHRGFSTAGFLTLVVGGQFLMSNLIKFAVERVRPDLGHFGALGTPSFPSGHATAAAATFAALALILGRDRSPAERAVLAGAGVAIAVAVGSSRALLGVHWFSDVVSGLLLGWTWFAICAVAFGGRLLWYGAPVEEAASSASKARSMGSST